MSVQPAPADRYSLADYNKLEQSGEVRYEYYDGELWAMAGEDPRHNIIAANLTRLLGNALLKKDGSVFNSDQKYHIARLNRSHYPDVSVVCGAPQRSERNARALTNPLLLVEVLSESTAHLDQGLKFRAYGHLPSLREYVLVSQDQPLVQVFYRALPADLWEMQWAEGLEGTLPLRSLDVGIPLGDIYLRTEGL